jgi:hypothetical protein
VPGSWIHLTARFFDVVGAKPLTQRELDQVAAWVSPAEMLMFTAQQPADQRHGYECGREVCTSFPDRPELVRAATLHDVGKRHARLGAIGRVFASIAILLHLPIRGRLATYARHGEIAAAELEALGAPELVVTFARSHHHSRPGTFPPGDWDILERVDRARLPHIATNSRYPVDQPPS